MRRGFSRGCPRRSGFGRAKLDSFADLPFAADEIITGQIRSFSLQKTLQTAAKEVKIHGFQGLEVKIPILAREWLPVHEEVVQAEGIGAQTVGQELDAQAFGEGGLAAAAGAGDEDGFDTLTGRWLGAGQGAAIVTVEAGRTAAFQVLAMVPAMAAMRRSCRASLIRITSEMRSSITALFRDPRWRRLRLRIHSVYS